MSILILILPFWIIGILAGWYTSEFFEIQPSLLVLVWIAILVVFILYSSNKKKPIPAGSLILTLLVFQTSFLSTFLKSGGNEIPVEEKLEITGEVLEVWESPNSERLKIRVSEWIDIDGSHSSEEMILLLAGKTNRGSLAGDFIRTQVKLELIAKKEASEDFPERLYWAAEGVRKKGWIRSLRIIYSKEGKSGLKASAKIIQDKLCVLISDSGLGLDQGAVLKAMILGQKDNLPASIKDVFRVSGISHLLAVSGLHVGLVYLIIVKLFFFFKGYKRARLVVEFIAILAVWLYAFITGFGPSVQRAAGMISLFALSRMLGRHVRPMQILALSFLLQTAVNPFALFSLGFQLSYLAVAGIFIVYPHWQKSLTASGTVAKKVWDFSGVSISAQTFTFPFILIYFQEFPSYFLLGNLLLVPLGLIVFYIGVAYIPIMVLGINFGLPAWLIDKVISVMLWIGGLIAGFPLAVIKVSSFSIVHVIIYFLLTAVLFTRHKTSTYKKLIFMLLCFLGLGIVDIFIDI